ncbi:hypothetical protein LXL04_007916 [Taraxacum kok-saghyz]
MKYKALIGASSCCPSLFWWQTTVLRQSPSEVEASSPLPSLNNHLLSQQQPRLSLLLLQRQLQQNNRNSGGSRRLHFLLSSAGRREEVAGWAVRGWSAASPGHSRADGAVAGVAVRSPENPHALNHRGVMRIKGYCMHASHLNILNRTKRKEV